MRTRPIPRQRFVGFFLGLLCSTQASIADENRCDPPWVFVEPLPLPKQVLKPASDPTRWSSTQRQWLEIARAFCPPAYEAEAPVPRAPRIGCEASPTSATCEQTGDTAPVPPEAAAATPKPAKELGLTLDTVAFGSFSRAGADEAIVEAVKFGCWDRFYLVSRADGHWSLVQPVRFAELVGRSRFGYDCRVARMATKRDLFVCMRALMGGTSTEESIIVSDFRSDPPAELVLTSFGHTDAPTAEVCEHQPDGRVISLGSLHTFELVDIDHDGLRDIRASLEYAVIDQRQLARYVSAPDYSLSCACAPILEHNPYQQLKPGCRCPKFRFPATHQATLVFLARGDTFTPTPATELALKAANALPERD